MKQNILSYIKLFFIYFFLATPFLVMGLLAAIPETFTLEPTIFMRIFFLISVAGLFLVYSNVVEQKYKNYKFRTVLVVCALFVSALFCMITITFK